MYRAPVDEIAFTLRNVRALASDGEESAGALTDDLLEAILGEAGRFASDEIAPLRRTGDRQGAALSGATVTMPRGWNDLYRRWIEAGWNGLAGPEEFGGQGLPTALNVAALEIWNSGSMAFGIGPTLTMGAIDAIERHATADLRRTYLPKLVAGAWMGTMNLTEPHAGSDLGTLRTRAEPGNDGTFRIFGQKIFITYGEHDLTDNIVHLVLARLPDAPAGVRGLSLFMVPKFLVEADGSLGRRNDVFCASIEHKLGLHASPTCTMIFGDGFDGAEPGAIGWLVGEANKGLACMFTMMNTARLAVGIQGVAVAEAATQMAMAYARERKQGRATGSHGSAMDPIVGHPDVRRNLLTMRALTGVARSICYACADAIDRSRRGDAAERSRWQGRADLLTPIAKSLSTDIGFDVASLGLQVHGGMGYIEETGAAALLRDARIAQIYEGTNGIQAIDLVMRKLPVAGGAVMDSYLADLAAIVRRADLEPALSSAARRLDEALLQVQEATRFMRAAQSAGHPDTALAGATPYLRLLGLTVGGCHLAAAAMAERDASRIALCRFFADNVLVQTTGLRDQVVHGANSLLEAAVG